MTKGPGSKAAGVAMAFELIEAAPDAVAERVAVPVRLSSYSETICLVVAERGVRPRRPCLLVSVG